MLYASYLVGSLWHKPVTLTICYVVISIVVLMKWHTKSDLLFYFITFILGPLGESVAIYLGAWKYSRPLLLDSIMVTLLMGYLRSVLEKHF